MFYRNTEKENVRKTEIRSFIKLTHGHDVVVALDGVEHALDGVLCVVEDLLSSLQIFKSALVTRL